MVDIAILCPIEVEFEMALKILPLQQVEDSTFKGIHFAKGILKTPYFEWNIALIEPGEKGSNFTARTLKVINALRPSYIFLMGVAGGIKDVNVGDLVIGTHAFDYESGKETPNGFVPRPKSVSNTTGDLFPLAKRIARTVNASTAAYKIEAGPIASGSKVITSTQSPSYQIIEKHYGHVLAVELEAYGFSKEAASAKIPYLNIRGISDLIDNKKQSDEGGSQVVASERAADFLQRLISKLPAPAKFKTRDKVIKADVFYLRETSKLLSVRSFKKAELIIQGQHLTLQPQKGDVLNGKIQQVKQVKMPGDIGKAWIKVVYMNIRNEVQELYLTQYSWVPGLSFTFGGSGVLWKHLSNHVA